MRLWAAPGALPGLGSPRLLLSRALEDEPGNLTFVKPQSCSAGGCRGLARGKASRSPSGEQGHPGLGDSWRAVVV